MRARAGLLALLAVATSARAQTYTAVYQGYATDEAGAPLSGEFTLFFRLFASATGGTPAGTTMVPDVSIDEGSFAVELPLSPATLASGDWWIAVSVGTAGNELSPRHPVASLPFALRGGTAALVGTLGPGAVQPAIASCALGSAIRVVNSDGSVECEPDAGETGSVSSVTPGPGLTSNGVAGDVIVDLVAGTGLQFDALGPVEMILGPGAATTVSRSDHDHTGQFWPTGSNTSCFPEFVTGVDPISGDVTCDIDRQTPYGVQPGGNLTLDASNTFHLSSFLSIPGRMAAASFWPNTGPWIGYATVHPTDFRPGSLPGNYTADFDGPGMLATFPGFNEVFAPLHLPHGAFVWELAVVVAKPGDENDQVFCSVFQSSLTGFGATGMGETGCYSGTSCFGPMFFSTGTAFTVDNSNYAYTVSCELSAGSIFGGAEVYSVRVTYQYNEVLP
jgi:hypothetical protein